MSLGPGRQAEPRDLLLVGGAGMLLAGAALLIQPSVGTVSPPPPPPPSPSLHQPLAVWLNACRQDIVLGLQQRRFFDTLGQYLREQWPDFLARPDIVAGLAAGGFPAYPCPPPCDPWGEVEGQWLRENAAPFWNRGDIQQAWFARPPRKPDVVGQFLRENGATRCASF